MGVKALGFVSELDLGVPDAKLVMWTMAHLAQPPVTDIWTKGHLQSVRHLADTEIGVYLGGNSRLIDETRLSNQGLRNVMNALKAAGVLRLGDPAIGRAYAHQANRVPQAWLFNDAIVPKVDAPILPKATEQEGWVPIAVREAFAHVSTGRAKGRRFTTLAEAMQTLVPLADRGFEWDDDGKGWIRAGAGGGRARTSTPTRSVAAVARHSSRVVQSLPQGSQATDIVGAVGKATHAASVLAETLTPEPMVVPEPAPLKAVPPGWLPAAESAAVENDVSQDKPGNSASAPEVSQAPRSLSVVRPLHRVEAGEQEALLDVVSRDAVDPDPWTQTKPLPPEGRKRKPRPSPAACAIASARYEDLGHPVGTDHGSKFMRRNQDASQAMLNEGHEPRQVLAALRKLDRSMPTDEGLRDVLTGKYQGRPARSQRATDSIATVVEGAGTTPVQTSGDRASKRAKLERLARLGETDQS